MAGILSLVSVPPPLTYSVPLANLGIFCAPIIAICAAVVAAVTAIAANEAGFNAVTEVNILVIANAPLIIACAIAAALSACACFVFIAAICL